MTEKLTLPQSGITVTLPAFIPVGVRNDIILKTSGMSGVVADIQAAEAAIPPLFGISLEEYRALAVEDAILLEKHFSGMMNPDPNAEKKTLPTSVASSSTESPTKTPRTGTAQKP